jgi:uncharacterized protein
MSAQIELDRKQIASYCCRYRIRKLALFGSVLRDDFGPNSDVDVLVEFEPGREPGFLDLARMERELSEMIGRRVDLRTEEDLSRHFRKQVVATAAVQYGE